MTDHKFEQYQDCGTKLDLNFAIDFTISNGNFNKGEPSLHSLQESQNMYAKVLKEVGDGLEKLTRQGVPIHVCGFGASLKRVFPDGSTFIDANNKDVFMI